MILEYTSIYSGDLPDIVNLIAKTPEMQRLSDVGMHCGCEYANTPLYKQAIRPYSRLTHSIGVARIIWHFTGDVTQTVAGLLHDISTPVFAHTIDFMNNDHQAQESTEDKTLPFIRNSVGITSLLEKHGIHIDGVCDYHKYPIADNDTPMLSADRLEYTLGNAHVVYRACKEKIQEIYDGLTVTENELGAPELCFTTLRTARAFAEIALRNSYFYVSDEDRFSMQFLADTVCRALESGALTNDDLYSTETHVIGKLKEHAQLSAAWKEHTGITTVGSSAERLPGRYCVKVGGKKRYIDPLALINGCAKRISAVDTDIKAQIESFLRLDFDRWLYAE